MEEKEKLANKKNEEGFINKKKKAFTLIELLAIIVILAIIAVITVPIILNIIENSRRGAASNSAYGYKDAVSKWYVTKLSEDHDFKISGEYTVTNGVLNGLGVNNVEIPLSGDKPTSGKLHYTNNVLDDGCLVIGDYKITFKSDGSVNGTEKGNCDDYVISGGTLPAQYGYKSFDIENYEETEIIIGTSGYAVTGRNAYLRYALTNGTVAEGTVPEACIYDILNPQKELCLTFGEDNYNSKINKMKSYFEYDEDTWTYNGNAWEHPTNSNYCTFDSYSSICHTSVSYMQASTNGVVLSYEDEIGLQCAVSDERIYCDIP